MKRLIVVSLVLCLGISNSFAQSSYDKNYISLSGGLSIPVGNYGSTNLNNTLSGFASAGKDLNITFEHKLNKHFGIAAMLYAQTNKLNTNSLEQQFSQVPFYLGVPFSNTTSSGIIPSSTYVYFPNWSFDKNSIYLGSFLLGGTFEIPIGQTNKFSFVAKTMMGLAYAVSPKLNGIGYNNADSSIAQIHTNNNITAYGFSYLINTGVKYKLSKKIRLIFNTEYLGTDAIEFKNVTQTEDTGYGVIYYRGNYIRLSNSVFLINSTSSNTKQAFQSININLSIGIGL